MNRVVCLILAAAVSAWSQAEKPRAGKAPEAQPVFYRFEYVLKEMENNKTLSSRAYTAFVSTRENSTVRDAARVSFKSGQSYNFHDVKVSLDTRSVRALASGEIGVTIQADISGTFPAEGADDPPVFRTTVWTGHLVVPLKKTTTVFSSDDPTGKRKLQLELTASQVR